jgi:hypothetical protein
MLNTGIFSMLIDITAQLVEASQCRYGALFNPTTVIAIGLDELDVLARAGSGDLDMHAITINRINALSILA